MENECPVCFGPYSLCLDGHNMKHTEVDDRRIETICCDAPTDYPLSGIHLRCRLPVAAYECTHRCCNVCIMDMDIRGLFSCPICRARRTVTQNAPCVTSGSDMNTEVGVTNDPDGFGIDYRQSLTATLGEGLRRAIGTSHRRRRWRHTEASGSMSGRVHPRDFGDGTYDVVGSPHSLGTTAVEGRGNTTRAVDNDSTRPTRRLTSILHGCLRGR